MTLRITSLDLALTATGIASTHLHDGTPRLNARTVYAGARSGHNRIQHHLLDVAAAVRCRPHLVVIESTYLGLAKGDVPLRLAELHGVIRHWLWSKGIAYALVETQQLKIYATGKGSGIAKKDVQAAVIAEYGRLLHVGTEHEADALALLALTLDAYGEPLTQVLNPRRRRAVDAVVPDLPAVTRG